MNGRLSGQVSLDVVASWGVGTSISDAAAYTGTELSAATSREGPTEAAGRAASLARPMKGFLGVCAELDHVDHATVRQGQLPEEADRARPPCDLACGGSDGVTGHSPLLDGGTLPA